MAEFPQKIEFGSDCYHPNYKANKDLIQYWLDVMDGGKDIRKYLVKFERENEHPDGYLERQKITAFEKLCAHVFAVYGSHIFAEEPARNIPSDYEIYLTDIDGDGTDLDRMLAQQYTSLTLPTGISYLLVTKPATAEQPITREDEIKQGLRPIVVPFGPLDLLKWDFDENGKLKFIVLQDCRKEAAGWDTHHSEYELLRIWTPDAFAIYKRAKDDIGKWTLESEQINPIGEVPLVALYNIRTGRFKATTEMKELNLADLNIDIYNKTNWLDQGIKHQGFPQEVVYSTMEIESIIKGPGNAIRLNPDDKYEINETTGAALTLIFDIIKSRVRRFYETAFHQRIPGNDSAHRETAEAKMIDTAQFEAELKSKAANVDEAERNIWRLIARWDGKTPEQAAALAAEAVKREIEVNPALVKVTMEDLIKWHMANLGSKETAIKEAKARGMLSVDVDPEDELSRIEDEGPDMPDGKNNENI